jgi:3-oxoacyl-[acyl-carrier protein] reductase
VKLGLEERVAVVTGAASGIGLATARLLAREGCRIVAADLSGGCEAYEPDWLAVEADVTELDAGERIAAAALDGFGRLDIHVACAGVYETTPLSDLTIEGFDRVMAVNVRGTLLTARAALTAMSGNGWGRIVLLSSIAAHTGGMAAGISYVTSKAAVIGLTRSLAHAGAPDGVTVNCVNPGVIETPMLAAIGELRTASVDRTPLGRNGMAQEVAFAIAMLCSDAASFITGAHIDVNGGLVMT